MDQYRVISDWRAFAILNLTQTTDFKDDAKWISDRLGISLDAVKETVALLERLEMISKENGTFKRTKSRYKTTEDIVNLSLQKSHQQTLELAKVALESNPVEIRDFTWLTFPMDTKKLKLAKTLIRKFQDEFLELMEEKCSADEVYRLAIQMFPLTKVKAIQHTKRRN